MKDDLTATTMVARALRAAQRGGASYADGVHVLRALTEEPAVRGLLADLGITLDSIEAALDAQEQRFREARAERGEQEPPAPPKDAETPRSARSGAALHECLGRADGLALAWGRATTTPHDWLLALLYVDQAYSVHQLFAELGTSAPALVAELRRRGLPAPETDPPAHRPWRGPARITVSRAELDSMVRLLSERHRDSDLRWGYRLLPPAEDRAEITAEEGIDLPALLAEVRASTTSTPEP